MKTSPSLKITLLLVAIVVVSFLAGFMAGSKTNQVQMRQRFDPVSWNVYAMKTLESKLDLSEEQKMKIQLIIDQTVEEMKLVRQDTVLKTTDLVDQLLSAIGDELTPEQSKIAESLSPSAEEVTIDLLKVESEENN